MPEDFREALKSRVLLADGAMGTELYRRGVFINRCYDELSLSQPDLVRTIHEEYVAAGADIVTTNTYGATRIRLTRHGLEDRVPDINRTAVALARSAAGDTAYVAGSIGPLPLLMRPAGPLSGASVRESYQEQSQLLIEAGVDLIVLETFRQLSMLEEAVDAVRSVSADIPVVASFAFKPSRHYYVGPTPEEVVRTASTWHIDVLGTNCVNGPSMMLDIVERMAAGTGMALSAMPNAGVPEVVEGRTLYLAGPEYMAEYARRFVQNGVRLVGGCCGTTPQMIKEMRSFLASVEPGRRSVKVLKVETKGSQVLDPTPVADSKSLGGANRPGVRGLR